LIPSAAGCTSDESVINTGHLLAISTEKFVLSWDLSSVYLQSLTIFMIMCILLPFWTLWFCIVGASSHWARPAVIGFSFLEVHL